MKTAKCLLVTFLWLILGYSSSIRAVEVKKPLYVWKEEALGEDSGYARRFLIEPLGCELKVKRKGGLTLIFAIRLPFEGRAATIRQRIELDYIDHELKFHNVWTANGHVTILSNTIDLTNDRFFQKCGFTLPTLPADVLKEFHGYRGPPRPEQERATVKFLVLFTPRFQSI